jgi:hypothetical protein
MLRGEAIAWLYGLVLFETVHMVERDLQRSSAEKLHTGEFSCTSFLNRSPHRSLLID